VQQSKGTGRENEARERRGAPVFAVRPTRRPDGPMDYGPHAPSDDRDPESHIFRGEN